MKILLLNQFFPPDVAPTARYLQELAEALAARGHAVTVLCSSRAYADGRRMLGRETTLPGVTVMRVAGTGFGRDTFSGRLLDNLTFGVAVCLRLLLLRPKPDLVFALTSPPYIGLVAKLVCAVRRCRHAHWVMDLYPDVLRAHGMLRLGSLSDRGLSALTRLELSGSALTVALGSDMAARLAAYLPRSGDVMSVPLWANYDTEEGRTAASHALRGARGWSDQDFVLMYSGNMGLGHRFVEILAAAAQLEQDPMVRWVFAGAGARRAEIERFAHAHPAAHLTLLPYAPEEEVQDHLAAADVHLVSMEPAWQGCLVPSKLQNVFALGKPVIFVGAGANSIAEWIRDSGGGWVVEVDDVAGVLRAVAAARDPAERARRGAGGRAFAKQHFDRAANCARLCAALEACGSR